MNNDGTSNEMIYIPANQSDINLIDIPVSATNLTLITADEQWMALDVFISGNKYLNIHRGEYAERNAARLPFSHQFDIRLLQEIKVKSGGFTNKLQITLDILNFGNMLNKKWGHSIYASNQQFSLINCKGQVTTTTPTFTYDASGQTNGNPYLFSDFLSCWRGQIGLRYIFYYEIMYSTSEAVRF